MPDDDGQATGPDGGHPLQSRPSRLTDLPIFQHPAAAVPASQADEDVVVPPSRPDGATAWASAGTAGTGIGVDPASVPAMTGHLTPGRLPAAASPAVRGRRAA